MKEELILYKQAKEARELTKSIVRDLLSVNLRKDRMSQVFLSTLERKVDDLIRQSQALKQKLRQLASELEQDSK
ncbi:MAG: hypothetical protein ABEI32_11990 [Halothece sp.]|jgi:hypothetical protein